MNLLTILVFYVLSILIGLAIEGYTYWAGSQRQIKAKLNW
ncbi:hypothetical protein C5L28_000381 [Lentilactobacillus parakefiri]|uniref:Uncharacterized protein n=1 Tax=Lentilactobacillus parakefiri TaxID=152332 RepID=A0A224V2L1_9LACO|nr:hypothetical protein C5L28_000381 [Lentilactobacillus parakefiri]GAW71088.1 hypothetical protein LPKJCM_00159 [Lentilactobacillus parakefiri]